MPCVLVDKDFFMIFDNMLESSEVWNARKLYMNHFYHTWRTYSVSPFMNAIVFVPGAPSVTSVTILPASLTMQKGTTAHLSATVVTQNFASQAVTWEITTTNLADGTEIDDSGNLTVAAAQTGTSITVKATSVFDPTKSATRSVTLA